MSVIDDRRAEEVCKRPTLRFWKEEDVEQHTAGLNDLKLAKWLAFVPHPYSKSDADNWIKRCQEGPHSGNWPTAYEFAIERKPE